MYPGALEANTGDWDPWVASREGDPVAMHGSGGISCRWCLLRPRHLDPYKMHHLFKDDSHFKKTKRENEFPLHQNL